MKNFTAQTKRIASSLVVLVALLCALVVLPMLSQASADGNSITVTNNSSRNITHIYLAAPQREDWGPDQLNDTTLAPGQSFTISNVSCIDSETRVIGEDQDGCFVSTIVACQTNAAWSITNEAVPNCGN